MRPDGAKPRCRDQSAIEAVAKCDEIGCEAVRFLLMRGVPRTFIHHEPGTLNGCKKRFLMASRAKRVLVAPEDEGGRFDLAQLSSKIILQKTFERRSPHSGRYLQAS